MPMPNWASGQRGGKANCGKVGNYISARLFVLIPPTANGEPFHFSFLSFFRLYTSLFLNSFGVQDHVPQVIKPSLPYS